jgi:AcrR family transcriptional regulator
VSAIPPRPEPDPYADPIFAALIAVVAERGYEATTVAEIARRAGVDRADFERRFADKDACALLCFEAFVADYEWRVESAYHSQPDWRTGLRATAYEVAEWICEHPDLIRFGTVDSLEAKSEMIRVRREEVLGYGARVIDRGRAEAADPDAIPSSAGVMAVGSIVQLLTLQMQGHRNLDPFTVVREMLYLAVRPYVGEQAAREELTLPRPPSWRAGR